MNVLDGVCYTINQNKKNSDRITVLRQITDKYDYSGLEYPVSLDGIKHFEELNKVCIYVYEVDEETNEINECKKGNTQYINNVIYLLLIEQDDKYHYVYIKHIGRLLNLHHYLKDKDTTILSLLPMFYKIKRI
jgi:hypothetical protein